MNLIEAIRLSFFPRALSSPPRAQSGRSRRPSCCHIRWLAAVGRHRNGGPPCKFALLLAWSGAWTCPWGPLGWPWRRRRVVIYRGLAELPAFDPDDDGEA